MDRIISSLSALGIGAVLASIVSYIANRRRNRVEVEQIEVKGNLGVLVSQATIWKDINDGLHKENERIHKHFTAETQRMRTEIDRLRAEIERLQRCQTRDRE